MTTKEKQKRKEAAKRHRIETPAVIVPPVSESNDLMEAAKMKTDVTTEDNPAGATAPVVSDQAANDATINTEAADDFVQEEVTRDDVPLVGEERSPTNEELATAALEASKAGEFEPDPMEVWFSEKCIALKNWLSEAPGKAHEGLIAGWMKLDSALHDGAEAILNWANKTNNTFRGKWRSWFPVKASVDHVAEVMNFMSQYMNTRFDELEQQIASKNTVDRGRIDSLLAAVKSNQKVRATKLYASLTGADLGTAKEAIEALA